MQGLLSCKLWNNNLAISQIFCNFATMMTIEDIKDRAEGQTFDCKSAKVEPKALAVPIVAMANADGGMLAIGISDKTRRIEGVDRMCKELEAKGLKDPKYVLTAFILRGTVCAYHVKELSENEPICKNVTVNANDTVNGKNVTVNSDIFTINGQDCIVNVTVNGKNFTINFTINRKSFTITITSMTKNILWSVLEEPTISTEILAEKYSCTTRTIKNHLAILKKLNVLKREGGNKNGSWVLDADSMWKKE